MPFLASFTASATQLELEHICVPVDLVKSSYMYPYRVSCWVAKPGPRAKGYWPVSGEIVPSFMLERILSIVAIDPFIFQLPPTKNFLSLTAILPLHTNHRKYNTIGERSTKRSGLIIPPLHAATVLWDYGGTVDLFTRGMVGQTWPWYRILAKDNDSLQTVVEALFQSLFNLPFPLMQTFATTVFQDHYRYEVCFHAVLQGKWQWPKMCTLSGCQKECWDQTRGNNGDWS